MNETIVGLRYLFESDRKTYYPLCVGSNGVTESVVSLSEGFVLTEDLTLTGVHVLTRTSSGFLPGSTRVVFNSWTATYLIYVQTTKLGGVSSHQTTCHFRLTKWTVILNSVD